MDRRDTGLDFSRDKAYDAEALAQSAEKNKARKARDTASPASDGEAKDKKRDKKPTGSRVTISPPSAFHETTTEVLETLPPEQRAEVETAKDTLIKKRKAAMKGLRRSYSSVVSGLRIASTDEDDGEELSPDVEHRTMLPAAWYIITHHASARVWVISLIAIVALIVASLALFLVPKEVASIINFLHLSPDQGNLDVRVSVASLGIFVLVAAFLHWGSSLLMNIAGAHLYDNVSFHLLRLGSTLSDSGLSLSQRVRMNVADLMRASLVVRTVMLREMVNLAWYLCMAVAALIYMLVIEWRTALTLVGCLALQAAIFVLQSRWLAVQDKELSHAVKRQGEAAIKLSRPNKHKDASPEQSRSDVITQTSRVAHETLSLHLLDSVVTFTAILSSLLVLCGIIYWSSNLVVDKEISVPHLIIWFSYYAFVMWLVVRAFLTYAELCQAERQFTGVVDTLSQLEGSAAASGQREQVTREARMPTAMMPAPKGWRQWLLVLFSVALVAVSIALIVVCYKGSQYSLTCDPISVLCASTDSLGAGKICGSVDIKQHYTFPHGCSQGVNKDSAFRLCYALCDSNGTTIEKMSATYVNWKNQVVGWDFKRDQVYTSDPSKKRGVASSLAYTGVVSFPVSQNYEVRGPEGCLGIWNPTVESYTCLGTDKLVCPDDGSLSIQTWEVTRGNYNGYSTISVDVSRDAVRDNSKVIIDKISNFMPAFVGLVVPPNKRLIVDVRSWIPEDFEVHWHGFNLQNGGNRYDGTMFHQYPIKQGSAFRYDLYTPRSPGTYWYHAHSDLYGQGLNGPIIVSGDEGVADYKRDYVLMFTEMEKNILDPEDPSSIIDVQTRIHVNHMPDGYLGLNAITGSTIRLRLINADLQNGYNVFFRDQRTMTIFEMNGELVKSTSVDSINATAFFPGVRYSVLVTLPTDTSQLHDLIVQRKDNTLVTAVRFKLWEESTVPPVSQNYFKLADTDVLGLADLKATVFKAAQTPLTNQIPLRALTTPAIEGQRNFDKSWNVVLNDLKDSAWSKPAGNGGLKWTLPWSEKVVLDTEDLTLLGANKPTGTQEVMYDVSVGDSITVTMTVPAVGRTPAQHPMHLHGFPFALISTTEDTTYDSLKEPPVYTDTYVVTTGHTYVFKVLVSEPGLWLWHCHIESHAMSMLRMIRANPPPIPSNAPYSLTGWNPAPPALDTNGFRSGFTCSAYQAPVTSYCDPFLCGDFNGRFRYGDTASWGFSCSQYCTSCSWNTACPVLAAFLRRYTFSYEWSGLLTEPRQIIPFNPCNEYDFYCKKRAALARGMWA